MSLTPKPHPTRVPRMSRNMSRHNGVSCDACGKGGFSGNRYKCLVCYDFDLCGDCYSSGETGTGKHSSSHPMQCILTKVDADLFFGGDSQSPEHAQSFTCPLCGQLGFSEPELREHVTKQHADGVPQEVICPVCATHPSGDPNHLTDDLPTHLTVEHRALREMEHDPTVQSRVRRLIGRRRAGLDRYVGMFRESGQAQDNVDPITELLSQLSSSGSHGGQRLAPTDVPPHIQQLLDQQERQALERRSPLRRPMYRKITSGAGGLLTSDTHSLADHITSHRCKRPLTSDEEVEIPPKRRIKDIGAQNASGGPTESSEKGKSEPKLVTKTEETTQSGRKRGRDPPASNQKRAKAIRPGKIEGDQVLMKIGRKLGDEWMDVGVALGMEYMDLKNTIESNPKIPHHLKPMEMFQKWKNKAGDSFTYATLATALEEADLDTCAQTNCYE